MTPVVEERPSALDSEVLGIVSRCIASISAWITRRVEKIAEFRNGRVGGILTQLETARESFPRNSPSDNLTKVAELMLPFSGEEIRRLTIKCDPEGTLRRLLNQIYGALQESRPEDNDWDDFTSDK